MSSDRRAIDYMHLARWNGDAAAANRQFFATAVHPTTGLNPDFAEFSDAAKGDGVRRQRHARRLPVRRLAHRRELIGRLCVVGEGCCNVIDSARAAGLIASNAAASLAATDPRA